MVTTISIGTKIAGLVSIVEEGTFTEEAITMAITDNRVEPFAELLVALPKSNMPPYRELSSKCKKGGKKKRW